MMVKMAVNDHVKVTHLREPVILLKYALASLLSVFE